MTDSAQQIIESISSGSDPEQAINEALTRVRGGKVSLPDRLGEWVYSDRPPARVKHSDSRFRNTRAIYCLEDDHPAIVVARIDRNEDGGYEIKIGVYDDKGSPRAFDVFGQDHTEFGEAYEQIERILNRYESVQQYIDDTDEIETAFDRTRQNMTGD